MGVCGERFAFCGKRRFAARRERVGTAGTAGKTSVAVSVGFLRALEWNV